MTLYIISQVLVCIADLFYVISMLTKKKNSLVLYLIISDILFASHYLFLDGGLTGAATIFLDVAYLIVMWFLEKYNKTKYNLLTTIIAIVLTVVLTVLTWESALSLLPMFSQLISFTTMIFTNIIIVKSGALIRNTINVVYMFIIASYFGAGLEIVLMISAIVGIILNYIDSKKKANAAVTENAEANQDNTNSEEQKPEENKKAE